MSRECYNFTFRRGIIGHRDAERNFMGNGGEGGGERSGLRTSHYNSSHVDRLIANRSFLIERLGATTHHRNVKIARVCSHILDEDVAVALNSEFQVPAVCTGVTYGSGLFEARGKERETGWESLRMTITV